MDQLGGRSSFRRLAHELESLQFRGKVGSEIHASIRDDIVEMKNVVRAVAIVVAGTKVRLQ